MMRLDVFRDAPLLENRARRSAPYIIFPMPLPEKALIDRIRHAAQKRAGILGGIGDDCAILRIPPGHEALVDLPDGRHVLVDTGESPRRPGCGEPCESTAAHLLMPRAIHLEPE